MPNHLFTEPKAPGGGTALLELELSHDTTLLAGSAGTVASWDMFLGASGASLIHILAAIAAVLLSLLHPSGQEPNTFMTVSLVELGESRGGSCDTGNAEGVSAGLPSTVAPPSAPEPERTSAQALPPPVEPVEKLAAVVEKPAKKVPPQPVTQSPPKPVTPAKSSERPPADRTLSSPASPAETTSGGSPEGRSQGTRGIGEGTSTADGGHGAGGGMHAGEFNADAVDKTPQALQKVEPVYPQRARKQGICGRVVIRFLVEADGRVSRPSIVQAEPAGYFEQSALDAILHWRFQPGVYRGKAVATWMVLPVQFKLTS